MIIFLDLKKALHTIAHKILIDKLMKYFMKGNGIEWFKWYLSCRKQFCTLNAQGSRIEKVIYDIPEVSCLGPLLFITYLSDF